MIKTVQLLATAALLLCLLAGRAGGESGSGGQQQEAASTNPSGKKIAFAVEDQYQANAAEHGGDMDKYWRGRAGYDTASPESARAGEAPAEGVRAFAERAGAGRGVVAVLALLTPPLLVVAFLIIKAVRDQ